jgi:hypothetical protein
LEKEIAQWFSPNYIPIGSISIAVLFFAYLAYRVYKYCNKQTSMFTKSPLDKRLNHLNQKGHLEAIILKEQIKMFKQDEDNKHHNIIKIRD